MVPQRLSASDIRDANSSGETGMWLCLFQGQVLPLPSDPTVPVGVVFAALPY